eukprot:13120-Heterococcus_DN1.PRE.2
MQQCGNARVYTISTAVTQYLVINRAVTINRACTSTAPLTLHIYVKHYDYTLYTHGSWEALEVVLVGLDKVLIENEAMHTPYVALVSKLIASCAAAIGWEPKKEDAHLSKLLRGTMIRLLGSVCDHGGACIRQITQDLPVQQSGILAVFHGSATNTTAGSLLCCNTFAHTHTHDRFGWQTPEVQAEARRRFNGHYADVDDHTILPSEYSTPVYQIVLKAGGHSEYEQLMTILNRSENSADRNKVYAAIGHAKTVQLKQKVLEWACRYACAYTRAADCIADLSSVAGSGKEGMELVWQFYQNNFERIKKMLANASPSLMDACIVYSCGGFAHESKAQEVEQFFKEHPLPRNTRKISQVLEGMRVNAAFLKRMSDSPLASKEFWAGLEL